MNIHSAVIEATNILKDRSILSAQLDTEILMAEALNKNQEWINGELEQFKLIIKNYQL